MDRYITQQVVNKKVLDEDTGELLDLTLTHKVSQEDFMMVFFKSFPQLMNLTGNQLKLLMICWKNSTLNPTNESEGNIIYNSPYFKQIVKNSGLDISDATINVELSRLAKQGILFKRGFGTYMLNPEYCFKGRLSDRTKLELKLISEATNENNSNSITL